MRGLRSILLRALAVFGRGQRDRELTAELGAHLRAHVDDNLRAGMTRDEAHRQALLRLGGVEMTRDNYREQRGLPWIENLARDTRHAFHRLRRSPVFAGAAVLSLALAIGANVSIFAVVERVLLNPLPYGDPDRLLALNNGMPSRNIAVFNSLTTQLYYQYLDRSSTLDALAIYRTDDQTLTGNGVPERIRVTRATPSLASVLRVTPRLGRWFSEDEGVPGASPVGVLSYGLWVRQFGQDPGVLGRLVTLDGVPTAVIGVMRDSFAFPDSGIGVWTPLPLTRASASVAYSFGGIGRMRSGATIAGVRAELDRLGADLDAANPGGGYTQLVSAATTLIEATVGRVAVALWTVLASAGLVLLVACANVANLFLVRAEARQHEVAVRRALGAGNRAIARYFFIESALLASAGGAGGLAVAWSAVRLLTVYGPANLPRLAEVRLDGVALAFAFALSVLAALIFGSIPLVGFSPLAASLHERGRGNTASRDRHRARHFLMGGQVALALVLLVASGLMVRSFQKLRAVDPGFDATSALTFRIGLPRSDYQQQGRIVAAHQLILDRLASLPGVAAVAASTCLPLVEGCNQGGPISVEGHVLPPGANPPIVLRRAVSGGYFEAMGMRVVRGRGINRSDVDRNEPIVVVNEALAAVSFPGQNPVGQRIRLGNPTLPPGAAGWLTIAGVVSNTPIGGLALASAAAWSPQLYMPMYSSRDVNVATRLETMSYVVRTTLSPLGLVVPARSAVGEVDARLAVSQVRELQAVLDAAAAQTAFTMVLLAIAASVALLLGVIGIYGVMSYIVTQRTSEIGVRLALGAEPGSVAGMIVRQGGLVALAGITAGLATAFAGSRLIDSLLYGVGSRDPGVFATATLALLGVALLACWLPARRAASVDPLVALRAQ
jgi:putative ABC transport system permease protein